MTTEYWKACCDLEAELRADLGTRPKLRDLAHRVRDRLPAEYTMRITTSERDPLRVRIEIYRVADWQRVLEHDGGDRYYRISTFVANAVRLLLAIRGIHNPF